MEVQRHILYPELLCCVGYIKEIRIYYGVSKSGNEGYLYFTSNNGTQQHNHNLCKRCVIWKGMEGIDQCSLVDGSMLGGDSFKAFREWWYKNNIENYKIVKNKLILNEPFAQRICYMESMHGYMNGYQRLQQNLSDFLYILTEYFVKIKRHINNTPLVQRHMRRYYHFGHSTVNSGIGYDTAKRLFQNEFGITDQWDTLKQCTYKMSRWEDTPYDSEVKK